MATPGEGPEDDWDRELNSTADTSMDDEDKSEDAEWEEELATPAKTLVEESSSSQDDESQEELAKPLDSDEEKSSEDEQEEVKDETSPDDAFEFLDEEDASSTKLDLARAYLDMGDEDGARQILDEVAAEGNEEIKAEARALLDRIA